jgi:hypothetical protein
MLGVIDLMLKSMDDVEGDWKLNFTGEEEKTQRQGEILERRLR